MTHCPWWNKWRGKGTFDHSYSSSLLSSLFSLSLSLIPLTYSFFSSLARFSSLFLLDVSWFRSYSHFSSIESNGTGHSSNNCSSKQASLTFSLSVVSSVFFFPMNETLFPVQFVSRKLEMNTDWPYYRVSCSFSSFSFFFTNVKVIVFTDVKSWSLLLLYQLFISHHWL